MLHKGACLKKCAIVEQGCQALPGSELALGVLLGDACLAPT